MDQLQPKAYEQEFKKRKFPWRKIITTVIIIIVSIVVGYFLLALTSRIPWGPSTPLINRSYPFERSYGIPFKIGSYYHLIGAETSGACHALDAKSFYCGSGNYLEDGWCNSSQGSCFASGSNITTFLNLFFWVVLAFVIFFFTPRLLFRRFKSQKKAISD